MTVEELLQLPTIKGLKLISGNLGIHREISTVNSFAVSCMILPVLCDTVRVKGLIIKSVLSCCI